MAIDILMPALSPTMEEGTLAKWLVKEGDKVAPGDVIAEIETDKATMEVEAVDEGVIERILVSAGTENVKVNSPIAKMSGEGAAPAQKPATKAEEGKPAPQTTPQAATPKAEAAPQRVIAHDDGDLRVLASPLAKRMAQQANVDLSRLEGTGPHGRIIKRDVEAALAKPNGGLVPFRSPTPDKPQPIKLPYKEGEYAVVPLDGLRKTVARRMTHSFTTVPHFPLNIELDLDRLLEARKQLNARLAGEDVKLTVNDLLIRASALALMKVPASNVSFVDNQLLKHAHAHVAVAVALEGGGLITPVIFKAETKGLAQISREMRVLAEKARNRKLLPEDYEGGTFTISNLGMFGIKSFGSIINEPQAMILSVGAGEPRPVVKNNAVAIATMMDLTLTCDHRAIDGAIGAEFLQALRRYIEDPMTMLL